MLSLFLICLTLVTGALAQKTDTPAGAVVTGRVVYEDTGQPATRHRVQLIASEALLNARGGLHIPTAMTNEQGEFSLQRVSAGEYYVFAQSIDERGNSSRQLTLVLARSADSTADAARVEQFKKDNLRITVDGQRNVDVSVRVPNPHFGAISGMVLDATRQPAARAMVHIVSKDDRSPGSTVIADEDGRYKVTGLLKGEYIVSANPPSKGERMEFQGSPGATYFPSTLVVQDSPPVVVLPDLDTSNVDITLMSRALRSVGGTVRMRGDNRPVADAAVHMTVKGAATALSTYLTSTDQNGHWSFSNVPDGSYRYYIQPGGIEAGKPRFVQVEQELTVNGADVEDLLNEVSQGARLSGILTLEGGGALPQFMDVSANSYKLNATSAVKLDEAGKFALTGVPTGEITLIASAYPEDKFYLKSMEANGLDLLRNNLTLAEGEEIKNVRIVISSNVGVITGRVLSQSGGPVAGAEVMLRRAVDDKLRLFGGKITGVTDARGIFTLSAAPGNYFVIAWRPADGLGSAMERAKREQGTGVTLSAGSRKEMDIRLP